MDKNKALSQLACGISLFFLLASTSYSQGNRTVAGLLTAATGEPLAGATVTVKGADVTLGTITDYEGKFSLEVPTGRDTLTFSYLGYQSRDLALQGRDYLEVVLDEAAQALETVVVTALGIQREEKALGYAVEKVDGSELEDGSRMAPMENLAGKVSGLLVAPSGNGAGGSTKVLIRGASSITGNNDPLYVVDGVPINNQGGSSGTAFGGFDYGNVINDINPDDIESISVLKGGAASALYGYLGANGVIMITTKKGKAREGVGVSLQSSFSVESPLIQPDLQNHYSQGASGQFESQSFRSWGARMEGQEVVNFLNQNQSLQADSHPYDGFFQTAQSINNTLTINKRGDKAGVYFSSTLLDSRGIPPNNEFDKRNFTLRFDSKLSEFLTIDAKVNYFNQNAQNRPNLAGSPDNPVYLLSLQPRSVSLDQLDPFQTLDGFPVVWTSTYTQNEDGTVSWRNAPPVFATFPLLQNPYWAVNLNNNEDQRDRLIGFAELNLDIAKGLELPFDLSLQGRVGTDYYSDFRKRITAENTYYKADGRATINESRAEVMETNYSFLLSGGSRFGRFGAQGSLGGNLRKFHTESLNTTSEAGLINENGPYVVQNYGNAITSEGLIDLEVQSLYGLLSLDYDGQVYLDVTLRNDWASNFPFQNDNNQFYAWQITDGNIAAEPAVWEVIPQEGLRIGQYGRINDIPGADGLFLVSGAEMGIAVIDETGTVQYEVPETIIQFRSYDPHLFEYNGGRYLSYTINREWEENGAFYQVANITEGEDVLSALQLLTDGNIGEKLVYTKNFGSIADAWVSARNAVALDGNGDPMVMAFTVQNGFIIERFSR